MCVIGVIGYDHVLKVIQHGNQELITLLIVQKQSSCF